MDKFGKYINSIVGNLKIPNSQKKDLEDELRDHLEMSKKEFMIRGYSEEQAEIGAIENLGERMEINKGFVKVLSPYRKFKILFSWLLIIIYSYILMVSTRFYGIGGPSHVPRPTALNQMRHFNLIPFLFKERIELKGIYSGLTLFFSWEHTAIASIIYFIPIGVLIPICIKKFKNYKTFLLLCFLISLCVQCIQMLLFTVGIFDINNTVFDIIGGSIGFLIMKSIREIKVKMIKFEKFLRD